MKVKCDPEWSRRLVVSEIKRHPEDHDLPDTVEIIVTYAGPPTGDLKKGVLLDRYVMPAIVRQLVNISLAPISDDYAKDYDEFWKEIVENPDGTLSKDKVMRELADYRFLMEQAAKVYCHVTRGRVSKTNTFSTPIIQTHDELCSEDEEEARADERTILRQKVTAFLEVMGVLDSPLAQGVLKEMSEEETKDDA